MVLAEVEGEFPDLKLLRRRHEVALISFRIACASAGVRLRAWRATWCSSTSSTRAQNSPESTDMYKRQLLERRRTMPVAVMRAARPDERSPSADGKRETDGSGFARNARRKGC